MKKESTIKREIRRLMSELDKLDIFHPATVRRIDEIDLQEKTLQWVLSKRGDVSPPSKM